MTTPTRPTTSAEITADWLTEVLRDDGTLPPDGRVGRADVRRIAVGVGFVSDLYRVELEYLGGAGPASLVIKLPTDSPYRAAAEQMAAYVRELTFYRDVAPLAPLRTARVHLASGATGAADAGEFALVIEDLGGLAAADHLIGLSLERAERVIDVLGGYHAWAAGAPTPPAFPSIEHESSRAVFRLGPSVGWQTYLEHARTPVPAAARQVVQRYPALVDRLTSELAEPATLAHGDLRADNLFFDADGTPVLVDFQFVLRCGGIYDVAYLISQGLRTADRQGRDRELVERYRRALGLPHYDAKTAWRQFRVASVLALSFPLVAMSGWDSLGERARELCLVLMERALATIEQTDALEVLA